MLNKTIGEKKDKRRFIIRTAIAVAVAFLGLVAVAISIDRATDISSDLFESRMNDTVTMTDSIVSRSMASIRSSLKYVTAGDPYGIEEQYVAGNPEPIRTRMANIPEITGNVLIAYDMVKQELVFSSNEDVEKNWSGIEFVSTCDDLAYAVINEEKYLCIFADSRYSDIRYLFCMNSQTMYKTFSPDFENGIDYFIVFYNAESGYTFCGSIGYNEFQILDKITAMSRNDGVSIVSECKEPGANYSYPFEYGDGVKTMDVFMSVISQEYTKNGFFSIGVGIDKSTYTNSSSAAGLLMFIGMIVCIAGVITLIASIADADVKSTKLENEVELVRKKADEATRMLEQSKELEHHQRLESVGMMTASIAHEFNNMLTPIMGYAGMLLNDADPENEDEIEALGEIYEASARAKKLVNRISLLTRKGTGDKMEIMSADSLVDKLKDILSTSCPKSINFDVEMGSPEEIMAGDVTQLMQLFTNLFNNAVYAIGDKPNGEIKLISQTVENCATITISDNGCGIKPEVVEKMFDPFYTTKPVNEGTGLGLAICRQIAENHGAEILVETKEGEGTAFTVLFPLTKLPRNMQ